MGPALRVPHHAAGNLPVLGVNNRAASEKSAMAPTLPVAEAPSCTSPMTRSAGALLSQKSRQPVRLFAATKGLITGGRSDHHGPDGTGRTLKADVRERKDTGEAWQSAHFCMRMSDSAVIPASPWPSYR